MYSDCQFVLWAKDGRLHHVDHNGECLYCQYLDNDRDCGTDSTFLALQETAGGGWGGVSLLNLHNLMFC